MSSSPVETNCIQLVLASIREVSWMTSDRELERTGAGPQAQRVCSEAWGAQLEQSTDTRSSRLERPDVVVDQHQEIGRDGPDVMENCFCVLPTLGEEFRVRLTRFGVAQIPTAHHALDAPSASQKIAPGHQRVVQLADRELRRAQEHHDLRGYQALPPVWSPEWFWASAPENSAADSSRAKLQWDRLVAEALR